MVDDWEVCLHSLLPMVRVELHNGIFNKNQIKMKHIIQTRKNIRKVTYFPHFA